MIWIDTSILAFGVMFLAAASPGPAIIYVAARTSQRGVTAGAATVVGIFLSEVIIFSIAILLAWGALSLSNGSVQWVKWIGVATLVFFAWMLWPGRQSDAPRDNDLPLSTANDTLIGFTLGIANPFHILFVAAFLPGLAFKDLFTASQSAIVITSALTGALLPMVIAVGVGQGITEYLERNKTIVLRVSSGLILVFSVILATSDPTLG